MGTTHVQAMSEPTTVFLAMTNADMTEGRGYRHPTYVAPDLDGAASKAAKSGPQGTTEQVVAMMLGQPGSKVVLGNRTNQLGHLSWGPVPESGRIEQWPKEKVERYKELRSKFPDRPDPLRYTPGKPAPLPEEPLYALVEPAKRAIALTTITTEVIVGLAATAEEAAAMAESATEPGETRVVQIGYGFLRWTDRKLGGPTVWQPESVLAAQAREQEELAALEAELRIMEDELRG